MVEELHFTETNVRVSQAAKETQVTILYLPHQKQMAGETGVTVFCSQFGGPRVWRESGGYLLLLEDTGMS